MYVKLHVLLFREFLLQNFSSFLSSIPKNSLYEIFLVQIELYL